MADVKRISSKWTTYHKVIHPVLFIGAIATTEVWRFVSVQNVAFSVLELVPAVLLVTYLAFYRAYIWPLVDIAYDCGDAMLVVRGKTELRIPYGDISRVEMSKNLRPSRIGLCLKATSKLGQVIFFNPPAEFRFGTIGDNKIAKMLAAKARLCRTAP